MEDGILMPQVFENGTKKIDEFKVLSDLSQIPGKVNCGDRFSNFTTDQ